MLEIEGEDELASGPQIECSVRQLVDFMIGLEPLVLFGYDKDSFSGELRYRGNFLLSGRAVALPVSPSNARLCTMRKSASQLIARLCYPRLDDDFVSAEVLRKRWPLDAGLGWLFCSRDCPIGLHAAF